MSYIEFLMKQKKIKNDYWNQLNDHEFKIINTTLSCHENGEII